MCRLMAYMGPPVLVADVVLWPDRSILKQSYDARERKMDASLPQHLVCYTRPATSHELYILMQLMAMSRLGASACCMQATLSCPVGQIQC